MRPRLAMLRALAFLLPLVVALPAAAEASTWSAAHPRVLADIRAGRPLVVHVTVALCSNRQIWCGSEIAGRPGKPSTNVYWGAVFGARRIFDRKSLRWERVATTAGERPFLERLVYRRHVDGERWGLSGRRVEQLVVLQAVHGSDIDLAMAGYWALTRQGGTVTFPDPAAEGGPRERTVRVSVAGYAGHNRLMDGHRLTRRRGTSNPALPTFVMACKSKPWFTGAMKRVGARPILLTRAFMAPEGFVVEALARGLGDNLPIADVRHRVVTAYQRWHKMPRHQAAWVFAPPE